MRKVLLILTGFLLMACKGLNGPIKVNGENYDSVMTDLGLTDQEVADVMNYIFTAWDNNIGPAVTVEEVEGI